MTGGSGTYSLENLLPSDICQSPIKFLDFAHDVVDLGLVLGLDPGGRTDGHVDSQLDAAHRRASVGEPASHADGRRAGRREA